MDKNRMYVRLDEKACTLEVHLTEIIEGRDDIQPVKVEDLYQLEQPLGTGQIRLIDVKTVKLLIALLKTRGVTSVLIKPYYLFITFSRAFRPEVEDIVEKLEKTIVKLYRWKTHEFEDISG